MRHCLPMILSAGLFESKDRFPALSVTAPRTAETYELEYFFQDGGTAVINGKAYPIRHGRLLFARPGDVRYSHLPFTCRFLHFSVTDPLLVAALEGISPVFSVSDLKKTEALFSRIISLFYSGSPFDNMAAAAELVCLLHLIGSETSDNLTTVSKAQRFIENHFREELSTGSIAHACDVSVSYLHKLFRHALNTTPGEYLLSCRISAARDLLVNTGEPLSKIALSCGFNSQSYFSDCFKKSVGVSPNAFRKNATYLL